MKDPKVPAPAAALAGRKIPRAFPVRDGLKSIGESFRR